MFEIADSIKIHCSPSAVFAKLLYYFKDSSHYKEWHKDHISCDWIKGSDFSTGSVLHAREILHNSVHNLSFRILRVDANDGIDYKAIFPFSLLRCYGYFHFQAVNEYTVFTAGLRFRINPIFRRLFSSRIEQISKHMTEEGISIRDAIEKDQISKSGGSIDG